jgi:hypothetical protein
MLNQKQYIPRRRRPPGFPKWPRVRVRYGGRMLVVTGWHLTPARQAVVWRTASVSTLAALVYPGWRYWGFQSLPVQLSAAISSVAAKLGHPSVSDAARNWICVGLWGCLWFLWPLFAWAFRLLFGALLRRRTRVRFTSSSVILRRGWWSKRYSRQAAAITFLMRPRPDGPFVEAAARRRGCEKAALRYQQQRLVYLQYGMELVLVAGLVTPERAEQLCTVLQWGNQYKLKHATAATARVASRSEVADV